MFGKWENKLQTRLPNDIFTSKQIVLDARLDDEGATPSTRKLAIFATAVTGTKTMGLNREIRGVTCPWCWYALGSVKVEVEENNKGADQPAHSRSLISIIAIRSLEIIIPAKS